MGLACRADDPLRRRECLGRATRSGWPGNY